MSRPSIYSGELAESICARLAGGESLRAICREKGMPDKSQVFRWLVDGQHTEFRDQYMAAREAAGFAHADRLVEIVDQIESGELEPAKARAMADNLKWCAERMSPKSHSSKQDLRVETTQRTHEEWLEYLK